MVKFSVYIKYACFHNVKLACDSNSLISDSRNVRQFAFWLVSPMKTQISLRIQLVSSESLLSSWRNWCSCIQICRHEVKRTFWHVLSTKTQNPRSVIRGFTVCMKKLLIICWSKCAQWRLRSVCADAQTDLSLHCAHLSDSTFSDVATQIALRVIRYFCTKQAKLWNEKSLHFSYFSQKIRLNISFKFGKDFNEMLSICSVNNRENVL